MILGIYASFLSFKFVLNYKLKCNPVGFIRGVVITKMIVQKAFNGVVAGTTSMIAVDAVVRLSTDEAIRPIWSASKIIRGVSTYDDEISRINDFLDNSNKSNIKK